MIPSRRVVLRILVRTVVHRSDGSSPPPPTRRAVDTEARSTIRTVLRAIARYPRGSWGRRHPFAWHRWSHPSGDTVGGTGAHVGSHSVVTSSITGTPGHPMGAATVRPNRTTVQAVAPADRTGPQFDGSTGIVGEVAQSVSGPAPGRRRAVGPQITWARPSSRPCAEEYDGWEADHREATSHGEPESPTTVWRGPGKRTREAVAG